MKYFAHKKIKNTLVIIFLDNVTLSAEELLSIIFNIEEGKEVCDDLGELEKEGTWEVLDLQEYAK